MDVQYAAPRVAVVGSVLFALYTCVYCESVMSKVQRGPIGRAHTFSNPGLDRLPDDLFARVMYQSRGQIDRTGPRFFLAFLICFDFTAVHERLPIDRTE